MNDKETDHTVHLSFNNENNPHNVYISPTVENIQSIKINNNVILI